MTTRDFTFWLQGFFEISNREFELLTQYQVQIIERHLKMVFIHEPNTTNQFCWFMKNTLQFLKDDDDCLNENSIQLIQQQLHKEFVHVIDPSMGDAEQQALLNSIHLPPHGFVGHDNDGNPIAVRC